MNILIVDDQYVNRYLLEKLLTGYGYSVISAANGREALEIIHTGNINLIISDILLPKMDGFQLCREVKKDPEYNKIPFVFYTAAYTEQKDREFAEGLGAERFIIKPTDPVQFIEIIRDLIVEYEEKPNNEPKTIKLGDDEYLSEHNKRLIHQLEKKLSEIEGVNKALRISERRYKNLFDYANDAIILHEITKNGEFGRILEANEIASDLLGYEHTELLKKSMAEIDTMSYFSHYQDFMKTLLEKKHLTFEGEHLTKMGETVPVEISAHLYEENGTRLCLVICRDITQRRKARENLARSIYELEKNCQQISKIIEQMRDSLFVSESKGEEEKEKVDECMKIDVKNMSMNLKKIEDFLKDSEKIRDSLVKVHACAAYGTISPFE